MGQSLTNIILHIVFSTKDREPLVVPNLQPRLYSYIGGILRSMKSHSLGVGGMPDHVHVLTTVHATVAPAKLLQVFKSKSSKWMSDTIGRRNVFDWQSGYGAFSVSHQNVPKVQSYIANQAKHHRTKSFKEEFIEILERSGTKHDPRYIWD